jgi:hypothetical protein
MDSALDPKNTMDSALDTKKTMDFVLFNRVRTQFMFYTESRESMEEVVQSLENQRESADDDAKILPPLDVGRAWGWDRLLPWVSGYVLFEDYFGYLGEYFHQNQADVLALHDAAAKCIHTQDALSHLIASNGGQGNNRLITMIAGHHHSLMSAQIIKDEVRRVIGHNCYSAATIPAAALMCIAEEASLMSELLARCIAKGEADKSMAEVCRLKFELGNKVRQTALDLLTTYNPYADQVSASLLGMKKEAAIACGLLNHQDRHFDCMDSFGPF